MTTTADATNLDIKHAMQEATREFISKFESSRPNLIRSSEPSMFPAEARMSQDDAKCVNHLICAMVLGDARSAIDAQITALSSQHVLELLA